MSPASPTTRSAQQRGWCITDPVLHFRALETDERYPLPDPRESGESILGAATASSLQLHDPTGRLSRRHAYLSWDGARWTVRDLASKNGLWIDGVRRRSAEVVPGLEIGVGGLTLLAESAALLELRALLARWIGWSPERRRDVDRALRGVRAAAQLFASLVVCGPGDLVPLVERLHRATLGGDRAFVACRPGEPAVRLLARAGDGTLCLDADEPPPDAAELVAAVRGGPALTRIAVCAPDVATGSPLAALLGPTVWLELPAISARAAELPRLIAIAADEAAAELGQPITSLRPGDLASLSGGDLAGHAELADAARRLVAIRTLGVSAGAARLGLTHTALSRWARRRSLAS